MAKIFFLENFTHNSGLVNYLFCVCKVIYIFSFSQTFNKLFLPSHYHIYTSKMPKFIISNRLPKERYLNNFSPPPKRPFHHHPEDLSITPLKTFPSPPGGLSIVSIPSCATTSHHPHSPLRARTFIIYTTLIECLAVYPRGPPPCPRSHSRPYSQSAVLVPLSSASRFTREVRPSLYRQYQKKNLLITGRFFILFIHKRLVEVRGGVEPP